MRNLGLNSDVRVTPISLTLYFQGKRPSVVIPLLFGRGRLKGLGEFGGRSRERKVKVRDSQYEQNVWEQGVRMQAGLPLPAE